MMEQLAASLQLPMQSPGIVAIAAMAVAGICLYAAFDHLIRTGSKPQEGTQALLTVLAFLVAGWAMAGLASYKAESVAVHAMTIKWALAFSILCQALFPWFVALFTGRRPWILLAALTLAHVVVLVAHIASPYGLFFSDIKALLVVNLPWGEAIVEPSVTFSPWRWGIIAPNLMAFMYSCYASVQEYRGGKHRRAFLLGLTSFGVYTATLHDMLVLESVYVAPYGLLGTVLALIVFRYRLFRGEDTSAAAEPDANVFGAPEKTQPDPARTYSPLLGTAAAMLVITAARFADSNAILDVAVLLTAMGVMIPSIRDAYHVGSAPIVRRTAVVALCLCVFTYAFGIARHFPALQSIWVLNSFPWEDDFRDLLFLSGIFLLFNAFRYAALEAGGVRTRLLRGNEQLTQEVTDRRKAEESLRESERRFRALIENGSDVIVVLDADSVIQYASSSVKNVLGYEPEELVGQSVLDFCHPNELAVVDSAMNELLAHAGGLQHVEVRVRHNDDSWRIFEGTGRNMLDDPVLRGVIVNARDITERRLAEDRLQNIRLEERERIRHDLHDSVGQDLTGILIMAGTLAQRLRALALPEAGRADNIEDGVRTAMKDVQAAIKGIAPVEPDPHGLVAALRDLVQRLRDGSSVEVSFECPSIVAVGNNTVATQLFRIAQEALTNALRHAQAKKVVITLTGGANGLTLTIVDDGIGILKPASPGGGIGMRTMRDRANAIGAAFRIESDPGVGTRVSCRLPVEIAERSVRS